MEIWKPIDWANGQYLISDRGRVKSQIKLKGGETKSTVLKPQENKKGYLVARVTVKRKKATIRIHREVARAFVRNDCNLQQVNHIDGNKRNNAANNLEWVTNQENAMHAIATGLWDSVIAGAQKSNENRKTKIRAESLSTGEVFIFQSMSEAARTLGTRHISDVIKGKRSQAKGFSFSYAC